MDTSHSVWSHVIRLVSRTEKNIFSVETSFCQFSNMASSGLKKTCILQIYIHKRCIRKCFPINIFPFSLMADVMPCVRLMLCLGWCYCQFYDGRCYIKWTDVITLVLSFGRCYCLFQWCSSWYDIAFHVGLILADVIAKWQDGTTTFHYFEDGRYYCLMARWNSHIYIERWQMLLPCGRWYGHCLFLWWQML